MDPPSVTYPCVVGDGEAAGHLPVPVDMRAAFGRARVPVVASVNGHAWRSTVAIMGGAVFVPFRRSNRDAAGVAPGDTVEVTLTLDTAPRTVELPDDLAAVLDAAGVRAGWDALSFSHRREWAEAIEGAKRPETRAKRLAAAVATVRGKRQRS